MIYIFNVKQTTFFCELHEFFLFPANIHIEKAFMHQVKTNSIQPFFKQKKIIQERNVKCRVLQKTQVPL